MFTVLCRHAHFDCQTFLLIPTNKGANSYTFRKWGTLNQNQKIKYSTVLHSHTVLALVEDIDN